MLGLSPDVLAWSRKWVSPPYGVSRHTIATQRASRVFFAMRDAGDTDLDLYAYDERGKLVFEDDEEGDVAAGSWKPRQNGHLTIVIVNREGDFKFYELTVRYK
jgi:hypothetical protein